MLAVQIVMFSPTKWLKSADDHSPSRDNYQHRYPPRQGPKVPDVLLAGGTIPLEDIHRMMLLAYAHINRRGKGGVTKTNLMSMTRTEGSFAEFKRGLEKYGIKQLFDSKSRLAV
ncbi:unnamed protein product [Fusarium equiseti]|uniref:Uncharacterized protein n=1 Tax=Fusarium equiseti TaxID=61235 RepID=A0A8J2ITV1_FUSEQ|nr:unnamed protein product [Fusarium equiseti]